MTNYKFQTVTWENRGNLLDETTTTTKKGVDRIDAGVQKANIETLLSFALNQVKHPNTFISQVIVRL